MLTVTLPTLHSGQVKAYHGLSRFTALRCGRRFGKTEFLKTVGCNDVTKGRNVGYFAPDYKITAETFKEMEDILDPIITHSSRQLGVIRTKTGGRVDFWTLENDRAGRSRKYHRVLLDEIAFTKSNMVQVWNTSIKPTLLDFKGSAIAASTPNGKNPDNFFYKICNDPEMGFTEYHAPTRDNPYLPADELDRLKFENSPMVYQQEYLAEFVDWSGTAFFDIKNVLQDGAPVQYPDSCDVVFAVIDTAVKTNREHDGTAVSYWAYSKYIGVPLICLDWEIQQIEGSLLEMWIPGVFARLEELSKIVRPRIGNIGTYIEDKQTGTLLLQQGARRGWPVTAIDSALTAVGKDERAISISGYVFQDKVKMSEHAYNKITRYKGVERNHFLHQVFDFKIGEKDQADDLLDTFTYAASITLGDQAGI